jgi:hypothetical protein
MKCVNQCRWLTFKPVLLVNFLTVDYTLTLSARNQSTDTEYEPAIYQPVVSKVGIMELTE